MNKKQASEILYELSFGLNEKQLIRLAEYGLKIYGDKRYKKKLK